MAEFKEYTQYAASYCPKLPSVVFARAMLNTARRYFCQTQSWLNEVTVDIIAGESVYSLPIPYDYALVDAVLSADIGQRELNALPTAPNDGRSGEVVAYSLSRDKTTIAFHPIPKDAQTVTVTLALKPAIDTTYLPDELFDLHYEGLMAGAIADCKKMTGQAWYDPQGAAQFAMEYEQAVAQMKIKLATGHNNAELYINYHDL